MSIRAQTFRWDNSTTNENDRASAKQQKTHYSGFNKIAKEVVQPTTYLLHHCLKSYCTPQVSTHYYISWWVCNGKIMWLHTSGDQTKSHRVFFSDCNANQKMWSILPQHLAACIGDGDNTQNALEDYSKKWLNRCIDKSCWECRAFCQDYEGWADGRCFQVDFRIGDCIKCNNVICLFQTILE